MFISIFYYIFLNIDICAVIKIYFSTGICNILLLLLLLLLLILMFVENCFCIIHRSALFLVLGKTDKI